MAWDADTVIAVWAKGRIVANNDPNVWRQDVFGNWIGWSHYGNRDSPYGWEIDHIIPVSRGGSDAIFNLRPLQWEANASRQNA